MNSRSALTSFDEGYQGIVVGCDAMVNAGTWTPLKHCAVRVGCQSLRRGGIDMNWLSSLGPKQVLTLIPSGRRWCETQ